MSPIKTELVQTEDGSYTMHHHGFDEEFHSIRGARYEADSLYMQASGFRQNINQLHLNQIEPLGVLDVGLGLGYNALMTIECWMLGPGYTDLELVSLEISKELVISLCDPNCPWKKGWSLSWQNWSTSLAPEFEHDSWWRASWLHPISGKRLQWQVIVGNALEADLKQKIFHYVWQDAFSPKKNPELWSKEWFQKLAIACHPEVRLVSYSVARVVRDHLEAAGWLPQRLNIPKLVPTTENAAPGKRQWLLAGLNPELEPGTK